MTESTLLKFYSMQYCRVNNTGKYKSRPKKGKTKGDKLELIALTCTNGPKCRATFNVMKHLFKLHVVHPDYDIGSISTFLTGF